MEVSIFFNIIHPSVNQKQVIGVKSNCHYTDNLLYLLLDCYCYVYISNLISTKIEIKKILDSQKITRLILSSSIILFVLTIT